jgi:N-acetylmuramoyl-L-alanine amidase
VRALVVPVIAASVAGCGTVQASGGAEHATTGVTSSVVASTKLTAHTSSTVSRPAPGSKPRTPRRPVPRVIKPRIVWDPIPFGAKRKAQAAAYAERHYGIHTYKLVHPHVIVIHYTDGPSFQSAYNTFAPDVPDSELHELPGTCSHFVIDPAGVIHQLVSLGIICRHTVGLNWTAIGIEHVGYSDRQILDNPRQLGASLRLVRWLRCRFQITIANVIGHNESLNSPYHHERVPSLRTQTHGDWVHADMQVYRARLRRLGGCPAALVTRPARTPALVRRRG